MPADQLVELLAPNGQTVLASPASAAAIGWPRKGPAEAPAPEPPPPKRRKRTN